MADSNSRRRGLPRGIRELQGTDGRVSVSGGVGYTLSIRWLRRIHVLQLVVASGLASYVAYQWRVAYGGPVRLAQAILLGIWMCYLIALCLNTTRVAVGGGKIRVSHGPIPWPGRQERSIDFERVSELSVRVGRNLYELWAVVDGQSERLVGSLRTGKHAWYLGQRLEKDLDIAEGVVPGDLRGRAESFALRGAWGIAGLFIAWGCVAVVLAADSRWTSGALDLIVETASEARFEPNRCFVVDEDGEPAVHLYGTPGLQVTATPTHARIDWQIDELTIAADRCEVYDLTFPQRWNIGDPGRTVGRLELDCRRAQGVVLFNRCQLEGTF